MRANPVGEDDETYREHVKAALVAYEAGDLSQARARFAAAYERYPNARVMRGLGTVELEQGDFVAAASHLELALASTELPLPVSLRKETEAALSEANAHVGRVLVLSSPADAEVRIDERPVVQGTPIVLGPGVHTLALSAPGYRRESRQLMVSPTQTQLVHWSLERTVVAPVPTPLGRSWSRGPDALKQWSVIGAGSALLGTGAALLALGIHDYRQLGGVHAGELSYPQWQEKRDRYPRLSGAGGALMGVGALAIASGWWWHVRSQADSDMQVAFALDRIVLRARY